MIDLQKLREEFKDCECGVKHELTIRDVALGSGITCKTGEILTKNGFLKRLLLVADKNTLSVLIFKASDRFDGFIALHPFCPRK